MYNTIITNNSKFYAGDRLSCNSPGIPILAQNALVRPCILRVQSVYSQIISPHFVLGGIGHIVSVPQSPLECVMAAISRTLCPISGGLVQNRCTRQNDRLTSETCYAFQIEGLTLG